MFDILFSKNKTIIKIMIVQGSPFPKKMMKNKVLIFWNAMGILLTDYLDKYQTISNNPCIT